MARLPYLNPDDLSPQNRDLLKQPINLNRVLVHSPDCRRASLGLAAYFRSGSKLDPRLRELAILMVGYCTRSAYEWTQHIQIGRAAGVSDEEIRAVMSFPWDGVSKLDEQATLTLRLAREITLEGTASQQTFAALRNHLGEERLVDLVVVTSYYNCVSRVIASLDVDVDAEYEPYLKDFPLPGS